MSSAPSGPAVAGPVGTEPPSIFKAYDIRGVVPDELDTRMACAVGTAFARFTAAPRVLVARDMRPSGVALSRAFIEGVLSAGTSVADLGLASTDMVYFASGYLDAPGAMFTASHNPARYNGIKLCGAGARPIGQESGLLEIAATALSLLGSKEPPAQGGGDPAAPAPGASVERIDMLGAYASHVRSFVDVAALRPLKVVADTANGMGGLVLPAVLEGLPFEVEILYGELDGTFPNHPADPIQPENLVDLQRRVRETGADVGLAFDGDADRVFLVDDRGETVSGSLTTALVAEAVLAKHPGATILYNLICSRIVPEVIVAGGGKPVRTRVGHSFIKAVMADTGAVFGGEHSGHFYFRDNYRADSGLVAALVVLELVGRAGKPLSELLAPLRRYSASGEINIEVRDTSAVIEAVAKAYVGKGEQDRLDGLTVDMGDWWFNIRPSNTEPLVRLNLEAASPEERDARVAEVLALVRELSGG